MGTESARSADTTAVGHVDVLIVGAGLSGIGAACRLEADAPGLSYQILEARGTSGGTWDLFRFPGVRSDSDMFTLSYPFRPWKQSNSIAGGGEILRYGRPRRPTGSTSRSAITPGWPAPTGPAATRDGR